MGYAKKEGQITQTTVIAVQLDEKDSNLKLLKERAIEKLFNESNYLINKIAASFGARKKIGKCVEMFDPKTGEALSDYRVGSYYRRFKSFSTDAISGLANLVKKDYENGIGKIPYYTSKFLITKNKEINGFSWDGETLTFSLAGYKITNDFAQYILKCYNFGIAEKKKEIKELEKSKVKSKIAEKNKKKEILHDMFKKRRKIIDAMRKVKNSKDRSPVRRLHFKAKLSNKENRNKNDSNMYKSRKVTLDRIMNGEYKICDSQIGMKSKTVFNFRLSYSFKTEFPDLDKNKICGVDMGIEIPIYCAIKDKERRLELGNRKELEDKREQFDRQKARKRKRKLKNYNEKVNEREIRWINNYYHNLTRDVIRFCLKNGCGTIRLEDLSQLRQKDMAKGGKRAVAWVPHKIKEMLTYKAKECGIKVELVKPEYTSQRCSECGYIDKNNRKEQAWFKCVYCGFEANADYNAAFNIANPKIRELISKELERQKKEKDKKSENSVDIESIFQ